MRAWLMVSLVVLSLNGAAAQRLIRLGSHIVSNLSLLSGNGQVVTGRPYYSDELMLWREDTGWLYMRADGSLTRNRSEAMRGLITAVSFDGTVVAGLTAPDSRPFRWRLGQGIEYLPVPSGGQWTRHAGVDGISADGQIVAGWVGLRQGNRITWQPLRWHADGRFEIIPELAGLLVLGFSPDGRTMVGVDLVHFEFGYPFRWQEGRGLEYPPGFSDGGARVVSYDGRVMGGSGVSADGRNYGVWRWEEEMGMEWMATRSGEPKFMSWDGQILAGWYTYGVFRWRVGERWEDLNEVYGWLLEGGRWSDIHGMSYDGRYLLGWVEFVRRVVHTGHGAGGVVGVGAGGWVGFV